jgi:hypothetical protein
MMAQPAHNPTTPRPHAHKPTTPSHDRSSKSPPATRGPRERDHSPTTSRDKRKAGKGNSDQKSAALYSEVSTIDGGPFARRLVREGTIQ